MLRAKEKQNLSEPLANSSEQFFPQTLKNTKLVELKLKSRGKVQIDGVVYYDKFYFKWYDMITRCSKPACKAYKWYGARGIFVDKEWLIYSSFRVWCEDTFEEGKSLDRVDNDGPYCAKNCKWSTPKEQISNRRKTKALKDAAAKAREACIKNRVAKFGDPRTRMEKKCSICSEFKLLSSYHVNLKSIDGRCIACKSCANEKSRKGYHARKQRKI